MGRDSIFELDEILSDLAAFESILNAVSLATAEGLPDKQREWVFLGLNLLYCPIEERIKKIVDIEFKHLRDEEVLWWTN